MLYPLQIFEFTDGCGDPAGFYSTGHHHVTDFRQAVVNFIREQNDGEDKELEAEVARAPVEECWWYEETIGDPQADEVRFVRCQPDAEGAYPVMVVYATV